MSFYLRDVAYKGGMSPVVAGMGTVSAGAMAPEVELPPPVDARARDIRIREIAMFQAVKISLVQEGEPRSQRVAVLVSKLSRRKVDIPLDYVGFQVDDGWVVGFGMDLDERYRDLDYLAVAAGAD